MLCLALRMQCFALKPYLTNAASRMCASVGKLCQQPRRGCIVWVTLKHLLAVNHSINQPIELIRYPASGLVYCSRTCSAVPPQPTASQKDPAGLYATSPSPRKLQFNLRHATTNDAKLPALHYVQPQHVSSVQSQKQERHKLQ